MLPLLCAKSHAKSLTEDNDLSYTESMGRIYRCTVRMDMADAEAIKAYCRLHNISLGRFFCRAIRDLAVRLGIVLPKP